MRRTILLLIVVAWLLIPTGTPDDILTFWIIKKLGTQLYIFTLIILAALLIYFEVNLEKIKKGIVIIRKKLFGA